MLCLQLLNMYMYGIKTNGVFLVLNVYNPFSFLNKEFRTLQHPVKRVILNGSKGQNSKV